MIYNPQRARAPVGVEQEALGRRVDRRRARTDVRSEQPRFRWRERTDLRRTLVHEFGHAVIAYRYGVTLDRIRSYVYTAQKADVVATLTSGETHIQPLSRTAAYDHPDRNCRVAHKRAYLFMARAFNHNVRQLTQALVWVSFIRNRVVTKTQDE